jgi:hypothetical protein
MPGPDGLVAYIVTVHQLALVFSALLGLIAVVPYVIAVRRRPAGRGLGAIIVFVGVTFGFYAFFSWHMGVRAVSVEVVKIHGEPEGDAG